MKEGDEQVFGASSEDDENTCCHWEAIPEIKGPLPLPSPTNPSPLLHHQPSHVLRQMIANRQGICPHVDLLRFDDAIAIVSLESSCVMHFTPLQDSDLGSVPVEAEETHLRYFKETLLSPLY